MKRVVQYDSSKGVMQHPCGGVLLWPIDHPDTERVSNASFVLTSNLVRQNLNTGEFETENTRYLPND